MFDNIVHTASEGRRTAPFIALVVVAYIVTCYGPAMANSDLNLANMSLEDLMTLEVSSATRKTQSVADTAAAVFVITQEDIRRSGVTTIPDALRMAPGISVARINSSQWAVTARGFNGRFARKLLVLIDGRCVYSPLFSGVFWDVQDTLLEDIERIEVIRGPGATIWGANAVNGVINIITKNAHDTTGGLAMAGIGSYERGFGGVRYGTAFGQWAVRGYGKYFNRNQLNDESGQRAQDEWDTGRGGFRIDGISGQDTFSLQGEYYGGTEREKLSLVDLTNPPAYMRSNIANTVFNGGHFLSRWSRALDGDAELSLQFYYDRTFRKIPQILKVSYDTFDIDLLHRFQWGKLHETSWGGGFRFIKEGFTNSDTLSLSTAHGDERLYNGFVQNDITLLQEQLHLILGSKFEHNIFTGFEVQPSGRLIWTPNDNISLWGAVSRAVHTPSRGETDNNLRVSAAPNPAGPVLPPVVVTIQGPGNLLAEEVLAYEAGIRLKASQTVSIDLAGYYNIYKRLIDVQTSAPQLHPGPPPSLVVDSTLGNLYSGEGWGAELAADWQVLEPWRLALAYTWTDVTSNAGDRPPKHQVSLRSLLNLGKNIDIDLWGRFVDESEDFLGNKLVSYVNLDARIGWRPVKFLEVALVGRNLLHERLQEYRPEFISLPSGVGREIYGKLTIHY